MIGTTVGHYAITDKLGEGGMGVVYKATDTKLDRTVALKFLPPHVSISDETKARFMQEAKAAAALNHANICTIHGVEEDGESIFIVMEYVDGGTLRQVIDNRQSTIDNLVSLAIQIAEALSEAHAKGIVHRDIKADNIMLTAKGQAKVMDFGLAKLKGSLKLTRTSSTVGTLAYMAPEQIQGGEVDTRSDIFSFGSLLFEMLTGKTPFRGEHEAAMVYSIVNEEPQSIEQLRPDTPPLLVGLIQKCLEKDPADRYQHMEDIASELRRSQKKTSRVMRTSSYMPTQPESSAAAPPGAVSQTNIPASPPPSPSPLKRYGLYGGIVAALAIAGWFFMSPAGIAVNPDMNTRVLQVPFTQYSYPSLSPDGKWIAFPAGDVNNRWDIYYMHVNGGEPRRITSDGTIFIQQSASISPDGSQIVYDKPSEDRKTYDIFAVSALGGTSRRLVERAASAQWRPDGKRVGFIRTPTNSQIRAESGFMEFWSVSEDGQDARKEFEDTSFVARGNYRYNFCWGPDGGSIAWIRSFSASSQALIVRDLGTGKERQLTDGNENLDAMAWTRDDRIIFSSNRGGNTNLWAIPASGGEAVQVTKGGGPDLSVSVAASGNELVYLQQQRVGYVWTANIDGSSPRQLTFDERDIWEPSFSPDGRQIAFAMNDPDPLTEKADVYVMDRDGSNRRQLTKGLAGVRVPTWSTDGKRISFSVPQTGQGADTLSPKIYVVDVANPGAPKAVGEWYAVDWADGEHLFMLSPPDRSTYLVSVETGQKRRFYEDSVFVWGTIGDRSLLVYDWRTGRRGWWSIAIQPSTPAAWMARPGDERIPVVTGKPKKVSDATNPFTSWTSRTARNGDIAQYAGEDRIRLMSASRGTEHMIQGTFAGLRNRSLEISKDGNTVVYGTPRLSSRLVLLENVFH